VSQTFKDFLTEVQELVVPDGLPENLQRGFRYDVIQGLIDISRWVHYYRKRNKEVFPFCSTYFSCGSTVVDLPRGRIQRVYTLQGECCPVFYQHVEDYDDYLNWIIVNRKSFTTPTNTGMPALPTGFYFAESSTDKGKRYNFGHWTMHNNRLYVGHRIESSETLVVEWEGIRREYRDTDLMPYDDPDEGDKNDMGVELKNAVAEYARAEYMRKYERSSDWRDARAVYDNLRADLMHEDRKERNPKPQREVPEYEPPIVAGECKDDHCADAAEDTEYVFAYIADWGKIGANGAAVQDLVESWDPEYIISGGDNKYADTMENVLASFTYYKSFVDLGLFFPTWGNHDCDDGGGIAEALARFPYLPGDKRNYDIQLGHVHFFFRETHDSGTNAPPDLTASAARLRVRLAASKAPFKVVVTQDPPYTSADNANYPGHAQSQLAYKAWGADLILSGDSHQYERFDTTNASEVPIIIAGTGGADLHDFNASPVTGSAVRESVFGAVKGTATCTSLTLEFFDVNGSLLDTLTLTKP
jgi:tartrate-resistant acid phosphatase type 5